MSWHGRELIIQLPKEHSESIAVLKACKENKVNGVIVNQHSLKLVKDSGITAYSESDLADVHIVNDVQGVKTAKAAGQTSVMVLQIESKADIEEAVAAARAGAIALIVDTSDWRIIPLENLIAELRGTGTKIYTKISTVKEIPTMFGVLERGVDGVVLAARVAAEIKRAKDKLVSLASLDIVIAKVEDVREVGMGDRACVDTGSILRLGEGMLVGSAANFLFLVHNESVGSEFTSPRPFRVNAGGIHSYILLPNGRTKYLSELECGSPILIANWKGQTDTAVVGRIKIERRPLKLVKARSGKQSGAVLVQDAETIRFVTKSGHPLAVTQLKKGDEIMVRAGKGAARHFGIEVDEFILEK